LPRHGLSLGGPTRQRQANGSQERTSLTRAIEEN
jgi:hypothetical protein